MKVTSFCFSSEPIRSYTLDSTTQFAVMERNGRQEVIGLVDRIEDGIAHCRQTPGMRTEITINGQDDVRFLVLPHSELVTGGRLV